MPKPETQCQRTCRSIFPNESELWCPGCIVAEAVDREANMLRWRERTRRENLARWEARFQNTPEEVP